VPETQDLTASDYRALGAFRYQIRRFLHFSETAAHSEGLEPQQHQMLLAIRALDGRAGSPTVGQLAENLFIRHHSAVGLLDRLTDRGLVERARGSEDRRQVRVGLTAEGRRVLRRLSEIHREELRETAPALVETLSALLGCVR
jgi:DNA-binding MarR family transcriptional regulator